MKEKPVMLIYWNQKYQLQFQTPSECKTDDEYKILIKSLVIMKDLSYIKNEDQNGYIVI